MTAEHQAVHHAQRSALLVHLVWLSLLFMQPLFGPGRPWEWLLAIAVAAGFTVFYLRVFSRGTLQHVLLLGLAAFLLSFLNTGAAVFYVYAAFLLGTIRHGRQLWRGLGFLALAMVVQAVLLALTYGSPFAGLSHAVSLVMLVIAGTSSNAEFEREQMNAQLREANERIGEVTKIAERERIARDMHDVLGHTLSVVVLKAELAGRLLERNAAGAAEEIREIEQLARQALTDVRAAISGYRSPGFSTELTGVRVVLEAAGIELGERIDIPEPEGAAGRIFPFVLREAVTNILRHSAATRCSITLERRNGDIRLEVADNGDAAEFTEGHGIRGMRERLEQQGGRLEVSAGPGGFRLVAVVPA